MMSVRATAILFVLFSPCVWGAPDTPPVTARELVEVRDLSGLVVSPDGESAVVRMEAPDVGRNVSELSWWTVRLKGAPAARRIASAGDPMRSGGVLDVEAVQWSEDSVWFYYRALTGTEVQVWRTRRDGAATEKLTNDASDVESFTLDSAANRVFLETGPTREAILRAERQQYEQGVVHAMGMTGGRVANNEPFRGRMATRHRGNSGETSPLGATEPVIKVLDLASRSVRVATEEEMAAFEALSAPVRVVAVPRAVRVQREPGGRVAFLAPLGPPNPNPPKSRREAMMQRLGAPPPQFQLRWASTAGATKSTACPAAICAGPTSQLIGIAWRPGTDEVLVLRNGPHGSSESTLYAWNTRNGATRTVVSGGNYSATESAAPGMCPVVRDQAICIVAAAAKPPVLEAIDLKNGHRRVLLDPNPHLSRSRFGTVESLTWTSANGHPSHGYLLLPPHTEPVRNVPLVITSYRCGGFLRGGVGNEYPEHLLASAGFAVLCSNLDPGRTVEKEANGGWRLIPHIRNYVASWEGAIEMLVRRGIVDPKRVGVSGLSFGGRSALYAISHSRSFAAASTSGGSELEPYSMFLRTAPGDMSLGIRELEGLPPPMEDPKQLWAEVSPSRNAAKIGAPLLIQVADSEFPSDVLELKAYMVRANKPVEIVIFPDESHQKWQPVHKLVAYERNVDWFRFWLQGQESPDDGKRGQYERWRALRALGNAPPAG